MTNRLDDKISAFVLELVDDPPAAPEIDFDAAALSAADSLHQMPPQRRAAVPTVAVVGAALLVLIAVGLPILLFSGGASEVVDEPTTTVVTTTTPSTTTPTSALDLPDAWQQVGADVMAPARSVFDMIYTPSGFVAVGYDPSAGDSAEGLVFSSPDGVTWSRLAADDPALTDGTVIIYSLAEGGPGLVAGGISCQDAVKPCTVRPTVWTSVDGASWTRSGPDPDVFTESGAILDVVAFDAGVVAVGNIDGVIGARPAAWYSGDGLEWSRVFDGDWVDNIDVGVTGPHAVAVTPDGLVVGVGSAENQAGDAVAAVWVSPDGRAWERVAAESFASGTFIDDVIWGPQGLIAVGGVGDVAGSEAAIWQSSDGYSWSRVDTADQPFGPTGELSTVAALADGYVAGGPGFGGQGGPITLWTSPDGSTWNRVQTMEGSNAHAVVVTESGIAVGGSAFETAAVWAGPVFDPYAPPPDPQPTTATTQAPPVAGPLLEWERIESAALDPGLIWAVASSDETIVAVGEVTYDIVVDAAFGETPNGVVWVSADGVDWTRIDDPELFGGDGPQIIWDVVSGPSGFVASGTDGANSVLWFSADGYIWQRVLDDDLGTPGEIEDLTVGSGGPGWIAAAIEWGPISSPTGVYLTSVNGIDWATVSDPDEVATLDAELRPLGHEWRSPYAFPASASERMPITHAPTGGDGPWDYAWNGDQVMAVARTNLPDIWVSPDAGLTWYEVDHEQPALDGPYPATQTLGVEFFDGKYVVVGFVAEAAAVWNGIWPEP